MLDTRDTNTNAPQKAYPAGLGPSFGCHGLRQSLDHRAVFNRVYLGTLSGDVVTGLAFQLTLLAEVVVFFGYCWGKQGETLGMRAWKIRIVNGDGELHLTCNKSACVCSLHRYH